MAFFYHLPLPFYKAFFQAMSVYQPY